MSAHENISQKDMQPLGTRAIIAATDGKRGAEDETRALLAVVIQAMAMVIAALRKFARMKGSCEGCGRVL